MAQSSDQKAQIEQLKAETRQIEAQMDSLQKMRSDLVTKQIEA